MYDDTLHDVVYREAIHDYDPPVDSDRPNRKELAEETELARTRPTRLPVDGWDSEPVSHPGDEELF